MDKQFDDIDRMIDQGLAEADRMIERGLGDGDKPTAPVAAFTTRSFLGTLPLPALPAVARPVGELSMSAETLRQTAALAFYSPHVQTNAMYKNVAAATAFAPDLDNPEVNAFATHAPGEGGGHAIPVIAVLGGAATMVQVAASVVAADAVKGAGAPRLLREFVRSMGRRLCTGGGKFTRAMASETAREIGTDRHLADPTVAHKAQSYAVGMMAYVIGHELGHIALGHTLGASANLEVSRNQEREADSFASSVISTCPFGEYLVTGPVVWDLLWVWCQHAGNQHIATTHPLSRERLTDFIRANEAQAAALGISESTLRDFLPPGA